MSKPLFQAACMNSIKSAIIGLDYLFEVPNMTGVLSLSVAE